MRGRCLAILALAALMVLTACFDYRENWVFDKAGNATVHIVCSLSQEFLKKNPEITLEEERLLLAPFWPTNALPHSVALLSRGIITSNSHVALDIRLKGPVRDLAAAPFFKRRVINFADQKKGLTFFCRFDLGGDSANLPYDGTAEFSYVFPGEIEKANLPFVGRKLVKRYKLSDLSNEKQLFFTASCRYPDFLPWKETLYVVLCFLAFFLFSLLYRERLKRAPRDPAPIPGDINSLADLLSRAAALFSTLPAVRDITGRGPNELNFQQLRQNASRVSHYLISHGLMPRERVAILVPNSRWRHIAVFGAMGAGGVAVVLDEIKTPEELAAVMREHNVASLIASEAFQGKAGAFLLLLDPLKCVLWLRGEMEKNIIPEELLKHPTFAPIRPVNREDPALLIPGNKDVLLTHGQILSAVFSLSQTMLLDARDVLLTTFRPQDLESLSFSVFLPLITASCAVNAEADGPEKAFQALKEGEVTVLLTDEKTALAGFELFRELLRKEGGHKKLIAFARILKHLGLPHVFILKRLKERFGIKLRRIYILGEVREKEYYFYAPMYDLELRTGYARNETSGIVLLSDALRNACKAQGAPLPNVQVRILDESGRTLKKGNEGFLAFRGPSVVKNAANRSGFYVTDVRAVENKDGTISIKAEKSNEQ